MHNSCPPSRIPWNSRRSGRNQPLARGLGACVARDVPLTVKTPVIFMESLDVHQFTSIYINLRYSFGFNLGQSKIKPYETDPTQVCTSNFRMAEGTPGHGSPRSHGLHLHFALDKTTGTSLQPLRLCKTPGIWCGQQKPVEIFTGGIFVTVCLYTGKHMTKIPTLEAMTSSSDQRRWTLRRWEPLIVWGVSWCIGKKAVAVDVFVVGFWSAGASAVH